MELESVPAGVRYTLMRSQVHMTHKITDLRVIRISEAAGEGSRPTPSQESDPGHTQSPLAAREQRSLWNIELSGSNQPDQYCVNSSLARISDPKLQSVTCGNRAGSSDPRSSPALSPAWFCSIAPSRNSHSQGSIRRHRGRKATTQGNAYVWGSEKKQQLEQLWKQHSHCGSAHKMHRFLLKRGNRRVNSPLPQQGMMINDNGFQWYF